MARLFIDTGVKPGTPPIVRTRVLNPQECGVAAVGTTFMGRLCFRNKGALRPVEDISHVLFIQSKVIKGMPVKQSCVADFDIYTTDGRVIEVNTCERSIIAAAVAYAPVVDKRAAFRAARRG